jgi:hypothetical protein
VTEHDFVVKFKEGRERIVQEARAELKKDKDGTLQFLIRIHNAAQKSGDSELQNFVWCMIKEATIDLCRINYHKHGRR